MRVILEYDDRLFEVIQGTAPCVLCDLRGRECMVMNELHHKGNPMKPSLCGIIAEASGIDECYSLKEIT